MQGVPIASNFALALVSFVVRLGTWRWQTSSASIFSLQDEPEKASIVYETDIASLADATCRAVFVDPRLERSPPF